MKLLQNFKLLTVFKYLKKLRKASSYSLLQPFLKSSGDFLKRLLKCFLKQTFYDSRRLQTW